MPGDYSRNTFDPRRHYSGVLMQQGRVQLDADWNEQQAIAAHRALGHALPSAVAQARSYILGAIQAGAAVRTGHGHGPLNHGYAPVAQVVR